MTRFKDLLTSVSTHLRRDLGHKKLNDDGRFVQKGEGRGKRDRGKENLLQKLPKLVFNVPFVVNGRFEYDTISVKVLLIVIYLTFITSLQSDEICKGTTVCNFVLCP